MTIIII